MRVLKILSAIALVAAMTVSCKSKYETVAGDPMGTKIYTMDNGLKVYMSVNKETPRVQTYIAVRVGGKNDPADNTGLAHYLEHIMFKGSQSFGTSDYQAEKPMLDQIQRLYDVYRTKTDPAEREALYHQIDSVSYEASKIAIPNEYDKLMSMIGSQGSNAFTSNDVTCYTEDIPSNQIENWAKIQADRFKNMVVRGFHTELEAVYEEFNRGLTNDSEKALVAADSVLFPHHPYGTQTVIGTQDHLKNPSITAILKQRATYYVPNNCAICVSGDFDPDEFVKIVEKYFGDWQPNPAIPEFKIAQEQPLASPVEKNVIGNEAEFTFLTWKYPGSKDIRGNEVADIVSSILYNGMAGLLDLDVNQQQRLLGSFVENYSRSDHGEMLFIGYPQDGQSLEEVRDILLAEVAKLRNGEFSDTLVSSAIANYKLREMKILEDNGGRAMKFVDSFVDCLDWSENVGQMKRIEALTKEDIVAWAGKYLGADNYVVVYKHIGTDPNIHKIQAPKITPIETNRDKQSSFLAEIQNTEVKPIEPVFVDYSKDMSVSAENGVELLYKKNTTNDIASLELNFDKGIVDDPALSMAFNYIGYLGTPDMSAEEIARKMYSLACNFQFSAGGNESYIEVDGLSENLGEALGIVENLALNAVADEEILSGLKANMLKERLDNKLSENACFRALANYVTYGPEYVTRTTLTNDQLMAVTSEELLSKVKELFGCQHRVLYYGPQDQASVKTLLAANHKVAPQLRPLQKTYVQRLQTPASKVYAADYDSRAFIYTQYSNRGEKLDLAWEPKIRLFNAYFGGGMNTIVFQEMREARALAYSASARLSSPVFKDDSYKFQANIQSQNDKLQKAVEGFEDIIENMPLNQQNFDIAKSGLESDLRSNRVVGRSVLYKFLEDRELGLSEPREKADFEQLGSMTIDDLKATQEKWLKDREYYYMILGDVRDLDMNFLRTLGPVEVVPLDKAFGY